MESIKIANRIVCHSCCSVIVYGNEILKGRDLYMLNIQNSRFIGLSSFIIENQWPLQPLEYRRLFFFLFLCFLLCGADMIICYFFQQKIWERIFYIIKFTPIELHLEEEQPILTITHATGRRGREGGDSPLPFRATMTIWALVPGKKSSFILAHYPIDEIFW